MSDDTAAPAAKRDLRVEAQVGADAPQIYFNGFTTSIGMGDVLLELDRNGKSVVVLNMSYTLAKTLAQSLSQLLATLEEKTGNSIMTTAEIAESMMKDENGV